MTLFTDNSTRNMSARLKRRYLKRIEGLDIIYSRHTKYRDEFLDGKTYEQIVFIDSTGKKGKLTTSGKSPIDWKEME